MDNIICNRCDSEIPANSVSCEFCGNQIESSRVAFPRIAFPKMAEKLKVNYGENEYLSTTLVKRLINYFIDIIAMMVGSFIVGNLFGHSGTIMGYLVIFIYYFGMEFIWGLTIGKLVTRTKLISITSDNISFLQVLVRTLSRLIPLEPLSILFSKTGRTWHDILSKTMVVDNE